MATVQFLSPPRSEVEALIEIKIEESSPKSDEKIYDVVRLKKKTAIRSFNGSSFEALKSVHGLEPFSDRDQFKDSIFTSLITNKGERTKCKFLIVVAMYNESSEHFVNTMTGVNDNLKSFCEKGIDIDEIACIVIVDGMRPFLQTYNKEKVFFSQFFDEEQVKEKFGVQNLMDCKVPGQTDMTEFAHIFSQHVTFGANTLPLQLIMCVKQFNKRKLNTHLWFFGGFCELLNPDYVMLLDVGTKPLDGSLFYLYEAMHLYPNIAGCCGEIRPLAPSFWKLVVGAQLVEYKFSHLLDKALESTLGYITVLPGAFSAYRWSALQGSPLWEDYFKSICHPDEMNAFNSNIYLAEDRVLCLSLVTKPGCNYVLRYVKKSIAETDVPSTLNELMAQRRRWVNGSWFALIDSIIKCKKIRMSNHSCCQKCILSTQMIYYLINVLYTWFIVGIFCVAYTITISRTYDAYGSTDLSNAGELLIMLYVSLLLVLFVISLGVKPRRVEDFYKLICYIMGIYQIYVSYLILKFVLSYDGAGYVLYAFLGMIGAFGMIVVMNCEILTILKGTLHYVFMVPTYVNIFMIYSICNIHDCTWGNRPDALSAEEKERLEEFEEFRTRWAIIWGLSNSLFAYLVLQFSNTKDQSESGFYYLICIAAVGAVILLIRVAGGVIYFFLEMCKKTIQEKYEIKEPSFQRATTRIVFNNS